MKILVIDNYDSFVFNLAQYLTELGAECTVAQNDQIEVSAADQFDGVLISPGPGKPDDAGISKSIVEYCGDKKIPLFGVCLGMQTIAQVYGAKVINAPELLHGKTSKITHKNIGVFENIPTPFNATRYHSLAVERDSINDNLEIIAESENKTVMGIRHKYLPIEGVQFHPEAVLTEHGHQLLKNWLLSIDRNSYLRTNILR